MGKASSMLRKDNSERETSVTQYALYYTQIVGLSEGHRHKAF